MIHIINKIISELISYCKLYLTSQSGPHGLFGCLIVRDCGRELKLKYVLVIYGYDKYTIIIVLCSIRVETLQKME